MRFERTQDYELVRRIATSPFNYRPCADDNAPEPDLWTPAQHEALWYVLAYDGEELLGMFSFFPSNSICWRAHLSMIPTAYGKKAMEAGRGVVRWLFEHSPCLRITGEIPVCNPLAISFARRCGFEEMGTNHDSFLKDGQLYDQILLGLSKGSSWA